MHAPSTVPRRAEIFDPPVKSLSDAVLADSSAIVVVDGASSGACSLSSLGQPCLPASWRIAGISMETIPLTLLGIGRDNSHLSTQTREIRSKALRDSTT